ncbi:MAG: nucleoside deaminase [Bacteroidetes bacterium]|nr:nucleoside deaminase [Bacteroidota bacterium]
MFDHKKYLELSIREAALGMRAGEGGPFGAVIVYDGVIIGKGHNTVIHSHDPTAHAEVNAIRDACRRQKNHHLTGATIYSNFEPCPMCLSAIYWADIRSLWFSGGRKDADKAGFMDSHLYNEIALPSGSREIVSTQIALEEMERLMEEWDRMEGRILY